MDVVPLWGRALFVFATGVLACFSLWLVTEEVVPAAALLTVLPMFFLAQIFVYDVADALWFWCLDQSIADGELSLFVRDSPNSRGPYR